MQNLNRADEGPTLVGVFDDRDMAERAVDDLEMAGFKRDQIGYAIRGSDSEQIGMISDAEGAKDRAGALTGMATGGVTGGLVAAAIALMMPGVGPVLAGGVLASFFVGAIAGTAVGGILGALQGLGVSEEEAIRYEKAFRAGRAIVAVKPGPRAMEAADILRRRGGYDLQARPDQPLDMRGPLHLP
jgi:hypothetical protein